MNNIDEKKSIKFFILTVLKVDFFFEKIWFSVPDLALYADQTGQEYDEDYIDRINAKIENIFDNLEDIIEDKLDDDSNQSLGI